MKRPAPPALSDLPLVQVPLDRSSVKQRRYDGAWYGFSKQMVRDTPGGGAPYGTQVVISHLEHDGRCYQSSFPRPEGWDAVAQHQIVVRVWHKGQVVGVAPFMRYGLADNYEMIFPTIWASRMTEVPKAWQRRGVAKTIYAHLKAYGFKIAPAPVLLPEGRKLWTGGLDPNVHKEDVPGHGRFAVRKPPLSLPEERHDDQLAELLARFDVPKSLWECLWSPKERRAFAAKQEGEVYAILRAALIDTYTDADEALAELLNDSRADEIVAELLMREPVRFGELKNPPPGGIRGLFRRAPVGPKGILEPLRQARKAFADLLREDDRRHRCTYDDDCKAWIGRTIRDPTD